MRARLFVWLQYVLPQHGLSRLVLAATRVRTRWFKNLLIRGFLKLFAVDMSEAAETDPYRYGSFNEFFTRALKPGARPIAAGTARIASPVDGTVSECGDHRRRSAAAGQGPALHAGGTAGRATLGAALRRRLVRDDLSRALQLSPRAHAAATAQLLDTVYVPGRLFSVNAVTAQHVPRLFARNERVLTLFDGDRGQFARGAGRRTQCGQHRHRLGRRHHAGRAARRDPHSGARRPTLEKGAELGRFNMGSTVILLFEPTARAGIRCCGPARWCGSGQIPRQLVA